MSAREDIRQAIYRYCAAIDRHQCAWMTRVFHDDATILVGDYDGNAIDFFRALQAKSTHIGRASHMIGNILFDEVTDDLVFTESYCMAIEQISPIEDGGEDIDRVVRLRYADAFRRRDDTWKIERRVIIVDHAMKAVPSATVAQFRGPQGLRSTDDPAIRMRDALGRGLLSSS